MRLYLFFGLIFFAQALTAQRLSNTSFQLVNSSNDELNPVVSPDGRTLYITIANHPENIGGKRDQGDIWFSILTENNQWSAPVHAGSVINDNAFNAVAGFSADGNQMFLLSHYGSQGNVARTQGISVSRTMVMDGRLLKTYLYPIFKTNQVRSAGIFFLTKVFLSLPPKLTVPMGLRTSTFP
jgi:hypothetical protein